MTYHTERAILDYRDTAIKTLQLSFPYVVPERLAEIVDWSIDKHFTNHPAIVRNNYKKTEESTTLLELANYILDKEPIITPSGVMFSKHGTVPNPLVRMIESFLERRDKDKAEMFKYPKGSELYAKFNLAQLLDKLDANATYGAIGARTCIYYNIYVASSVTHQGAAAVSAASLLFESFLSDNVGFSSLNDIIMFIRNVVDEERHWDDLSILDNAYISPARCFRKIVINCKFGYIPTTDHMNIIWNILTNLTPRDLTRLYYKNNLYEFIENSFVMNKIITMLTKLRLPYVNPNKPPKIIADDLDEFWSLLKEFVYYDKQIVDRLGKMDNIIRDTSIIMDTDSAIISVDAWYRCVLNHVYNIDMDIKNHIYTSDEIFIKNEFDEFGDMTNELDCLETPLKVVQDVEPPLTYDMYTDEVIEADVSVNRDEIVPQDGLRYSIINILAYCITKMINDYMYKFAVQSNAIHPTKGCFFIMKNEFLFKRVLDTMGKKNYATIQELQEGNLIPKNKQLDIKGLPIDKVGLQPTIKKKLHKILYEDVLNAVSVDQMSVLKKLVVIEKDICNAIANGSKDYYKPVTVKAYTSYDKPMSIQGIKASVVYNELRDPDLEAIDLTKRNSIDIAKINLNKKNVNKIANEFPETYERMVKLLQSKDFSDGISAIAIPIDVEVPKWIIPFVEYTDVINDNLKNFPLEYIGLSQTVNKHVNYTNILSI